MSLSPQDIQGKEFREAFRGYNQDDVDGFLDEVSESYARLAQENQRLRIQTAALQQEVARLREAKDAEVNAAFEDARGQVKGQVKGEVRRALVAAQNASETIVAEAKKKAGELIADAERRAKEIDEQAAQHARELDPVLATTVEDLQRGIQELRRRETEIKQRLREALEEQLSLLDQSEAKQRHAATVERMSQELAEQTAGTEPNPQRFWSEPSQT